MSGIQIDNVYQIIIEKVDEDLEKFDSRVSATIQTIISSFFKNSQNAIIYICDDKDHKGKKRFDAFERWYKTSEFNNSITKVNNIIVFNTDNQDWTLYTSLLYHQKNANKNTIIEVYNTLQEILNDK